MSKQNDEYTSHIYIQENYDNIERLLMCTYEDKLKSWDTAQSKR